MGKLVLILQHNSACAEFWQATRRVVLTHFSYFAYRISIFKLQMWSNSSYFLNLDNSGRKNYKDKLTLSDNTILPDNLCPATRYVECGIE